MNPTDSTLSLGSTPTTRAPVQRSASRDQETREMTQATENWVAPGRLPEPIPRPGVRYKWVRVATQGVADKTNVHRALTQGWVVVSGNDVPELGHLINHAATATNRDGVVSSTVEFGGLILMQIGERAATQRDTYYRKMHEQQEASIETNLRQNEDARMPMQAKRKSKVTIGAKASEDF